MIRKAIFGILPLLLLAVVTSSVQAADRDYPEAKTQWLDAEGAFPDIEDWNTKGEWIWPDKSPAAPLPRPLYRHWIELPEGYQLERVDGNADRVLNRPSPSPQSPYNPMRSIAIETTQSETTVTLYLKSPAGKLRKLTYLVWLLQDASLEFIDDDCREMGFQFITTQNKSKHLYTTLVCTEDPNSHFIYALLSQDATLAESKLRASPLKTKNWIRFKFPKKNLSTQITTLQGTFRVSKKGSNEFSEYQLQQFPVGDVPEPPMDLFFDIAGGLRLMSHYTFSETLATPPKSLLLEVQGLFRYGELGSAYIGIGYGISGAKSLTVGIGVQVALFKLWDLVEPHLVIDYIYYDWEASEYYEASGTAARYGAVLSWEFHPQFKLLTGAMVSVFANTGFISPYVLGSFRLF